MLRFFFNGSQYYPKIPETAQLKARSLLPAKPRSLGVITLSCLGELDLGLFHRPGLAARTGTLEQQITQ